MYRKLTNFSVILDFELQTDQRNKKDFRNSCEFQKRSIVVMMDSHRQTGTTEKEYFTLVLTKNYSNLVAALSYC